MDIFSCLSASRITGIDAAIQVFPIFFANQVRAHEEADANSFAGVHFLLSGPELVTRVAGI
ncbi:MAG TPA: hypothetical protein VNT79_17880 [Phycisphaerae bacterium]|nr:hypothetical protein [Phycisphaerae bacterium]